ncbi:MAG: ABC transporter ATP-binding protein [Bacteroidetes bacterium]|nr:MAG: ABC transporter ATP-binding protein [Bacteroidota bacterium]
MKSLSYLNKYLFKYKWRLLLGVVFIIISNYFGVEMPKVVKGAVNDFLKTLDANMAFQDVLMLSLKLAGMYMLLSLGKGFFLFLTRQMIIVVSRYIEYDLKNEVYAQYQKLNFAFYKKSRTGDLMNRISEDVTQVRMYLGPGLMYTINLAVLFVLAIVTMLQINVSLTLLVLAPLPVMSFLIYWVSSKMNRLSKIKQEEQSNLSTIVQESFSGIRVIKAYLRELETRRKFDASADEYKRKNMRLVMVNSLFMPTIIFLIGLSTLLTIYYGGLLTYDKEITPGDIVAFVFYVNMLTWPFASVGWVTSIIQRAAASQARINEFLKIVPKIKNEEKGSLDDLDEIRFEGVHFQFDDADKPAIQDLSFSVRRGETLGIVGRTGSGKSTILNLMTRQLEVTQGSITINGKDIRKVNLDAYRSRVGVVPQDVFLFSDTIRNNVAFGVDTEEATDEDLIKVCKTAHVYHNIMDFKEGFETILGERGVNLSGGQKQRLSIARALLRRPQLLLLDDCLSAVDTETEDVILRSIDEDYKHCMNVIVSHRVSSLRMADKIIVIEHGQKIEEGTHEELIAAGGVYAEMHHKQLVSESV